MVKAYENHQIVFQKYNISNRDIFKTFRLHAFLGYSRGKGDVNICFFVFGK